MHRMGDASPERNGDLTPVRPGMGLLVGVGLSIPLWGVMAGLMWLARPHVRPLLGTVLAWAVALAHVT